MSGSYRPQLPPSLLSTGVVAVLRTVSAERYAPVVHALVEAGIRSVELTLTTPGTLDALPRLLDEVPNVELGVGTVRTAADAEAAIRAGAHFLVTPTLARDAATAARAAHIPLIMGALTPSEVADAWDSGATAVKIFPAASLGPDYLRHLSGPLPDVQVIPSGGVAIEDCCSWTRAGAVAVSVGGPLVGDALEGGDLQALKRRARLALEGVSDGRA